MEKQQLGSLGGREKEKGEQVHSMDSTLDSTTKHQVLEKFQRQVVERLQDLASVDSTNLLSVS
ncbi:hypothetical protein LguiB_019447 [Lonicera macranthoides]